MGTCRSSLVLLKLALLAPIEKALSNDLECSAYFVDLPLTELEYARQTYKDVPLNLHLLIDEIIADG